MISAQQAKLNNYKNTKLKLLKAYIQLWLNNSDFGKDIVTP